MGEKTALFKSVQPPKNQAANCHLKSHQSPNHQTKLLHAERTNIPNPVVGRKFLQRCNRKMAHFHVSSLSNPSLQLPRIGKGSLHFEAAWEALWRFMYRRGVTPLVSEPYDCVALTWYSGWWEWFWWREPSKTALGCLLKSVTYQHLEEWSSAQGAACFGMLFLSVGSLRYPPCLSGTNLQILVTLTSWDHTH